MTDEQFNQRYVQVILDPTSQCNVNGIPTMGSGCAQGQMYNMSGRWSCSGNCTLSVTALSQTPINSSSPANAYNMSVVYQPNGVFSGSGPGLVGASMQSGQNFGSSYTELSVDINSDATIASAALVSGSLATTSAGVGPYAIAQNYNCTMSGCTFSGFYLVDNLGVPYSQSSNVSGASGISTASVNVCTAQSCNSYTNVVTYTAAYFNTLGAIFPFSDSGSGSFQSVAETAQIFSGPAANPTYNCSLDPFFIDTNGNGVLDYQTNATTGVVTCSEVSFNNAMAAADYIWGRNGQTAHPSAAAKMIPNPANGYNYGDPNSATSLLHVVFGPLLDGKHSLTPTTALNAVQAFGLVYMLLSSNNNKVNVNGLLPNTNGHPQNTFEIVMPVCGNGTLAECNAAIAGGFTTYGEE